MGIESTEGGTVPQSVNEIFGRNLDTLCRESGTYSDVARALDISRVQLARYIRGESYPKPSMLAKICKHFKTDARIYLQPLDEIAVEQGQVEPPSFQPTSDLPETLRGYTGRDIPIVDGIHMIYRPSFTLPNVFLSMPLLVRRRKGAIWLKGMDAPVYGARRRDCGLFRDRSYAGFALSSSDGFVFSFHGTGTVSFLSLAYFFSTGYFASTGSYRGIYEIFRPAQPGEKRRVPMVLAPLRQVPGVILNAVRRSGFRPLDDLPQHVRPFLSEAAVV